jgi:hypothetical protein
MTSLTRKVLCASGVLCFAALSAAVAHADEIVLENGDVITGKVTKLEKGVVTVTTAYSEPVSINASKISKITTDEAVEVHLIGGEVIRGALSSSGPGRVVVAPTGTREGVVISWDKVESVNPPPPVVKWTGNISIGATSQSGNTERTSVSVGGDPEKRIDRATFRLLYNYRRRTLTARNVYGSLNTIFSLKSSTVISVEMSSDKFKNIRFRNIVGPGVGTRYGTTR